MTERYDTMAKPRPPLRLAHPLRARSERAAQGLRDTTWAVVVAPDRSITGRRAPTESAPDVTRSYARARRVHAVMGLRLRSRRVRSRGCRDRESR
jgi:hypothetical protein